MVLAAGRGTRLGRLSESVPKPLVEVAGRPVLHWTLEWLAAAGARDVWLNLHHLGEKIRAAVGDGTRFGLSVRYSPEPALLGTAGGWRRVAQLAPTARWLVVYGDNVMRFDLRAFVGAHLSAQPSVAATVALFDGARHGNTGLAGGRAQLSSDGRVLRFVEGASREGGLVNAGAYVIESTVAGEVPEGPMDFGHDVLPALASAGRLRGHLLEPGAFCLGVDTPAALARAQAMMASAEVAP